MIGSVRPKSSKRKAKGVPKPKHKKQVKLNNWLSGYAEHELEQRVFKRF